MVRPRVRLRPRAYQLFLGRKTDDDPRDRCQQVMQISMMIAVVVMGVLIAEEFRPAKPIHDRT